MLYTVYCMLYADVKGFSKFFLKNFSDGGYSTMRWRESSIAMIFIVQFAEGDKGDTYIRVSADIGIGEKKWRAVTGYRFT